MPSTRRKDTESALLAVRDLSVSFDTPGGTVTAVDDISFDIHPGEVLAVVGESGSGKSQTALAITGLLARNASFSGSVRWEGREILGLPDSRLADLRAREITMVFQNPMTSLNPYLRISTQMMECLHWKGRMTRTAARQHCAEMLRKVHIDDPASRIDRYPHELSGGMQQRIMIAMSLMRKPRLLIADEPTTALDVTVQMQIVRLLDEIRRSFRTAILLITHDLGLVASISERIAIMYSGQIVEVGPVEAIFHRPRHPYTQALLETAPKIDRDMPELPGIAGEPPDPMNRPIGCPFHERCQKRLQQCREIRPAMENDGDHSHACHLPNAS